MNSELKPCPFCGGKAEVVYINDTMGHLQLKGYNVQCSKCWCKTKPNNYEGNKQIAIDRWNTRAERTCHPVRCTGKEFTEGEEYTSLDAYCSKCREWLGEADDVFGSLPDRYCPGCGAKVVSE